jgi:hypothetical protein
MRKKERGPIRMVLLKRPNEPSPYDGLILVEPSALKNENRYWTNCRRRVGFEFIDTDTSWPNSWRMAFSVPTGGRTARLLGSGATGDEG